MVVAKPLSFEDMADRLRRIHLSGAFRTWYTKIQLEDCGNGFWVHVTVDVEDSDNHKPSAFTHSYPYFYYPDAELFDRLIISCVRQVILHELGEGLWVGVDRPLYPHHNVSPK